MKTVHEFFVSDEPDEAIRKIKITLNRVGELTRVEAGQLIRGKIAFGVRPVSLEITFKSEDATTKMDQAMGGRAATIPQIGTHIFIEATADDNTRAAQKNAVERFEDAYRHFDRTDYKADRLGIMPITILGILIAVILLGVLLWRIPSFRRNLPQIIPAALKDQVKPTTEAPENKDDTKTGDSSNADANK